MKSLEYCFFPYFNQIRTNLPFYFFPFPIPRLDWVNGWLYCWYVYPLLHTLSDNPVCHEWWMYLTILVTLWSFFPFFWACVFFTFSLHTFWKSKNAQFILNGLTIITWWYEKWQQVPFSNVSKFNILCPIQFVPRYIFLHDWLLNQVLYTPTGCQKALLYCTLMYISLYFSLPFRLKCSFLTVNVFFSF